MHGRSEARRRMRNIGPRAAAIVALTVVGAACSSSAHSSSPNARTATTNTSTSTTPTSTSTIPTRISTTAGRRGTFRSCMAAHGVSLPQPQRSNNATPPSTGQRTGPVSGDARFLQPPAGVDPTKYRSALNACRSQVFNGARFRGNGRKRAPGFPAGHVVVYKVTGSARSASIVYVDSGGANNAQASVPYQMTVTLTSDAPFSVIAARYRRINDQLRGTDRRQDDHDRRCGHARPRRMQRHRPVAELPDCASDSHRRPHHRPLSARHGADLGGHGPGLWDGRSCSGTGHYDYVVRR